ncbi:hypothetical protein [Streptomyces sp. NPDC005209]
MGVLITVVVVAVAGVVGRLVRRSPSERPEPVPVPVRHVMRSPHH